MEKLLPRKRMIWPSIILCLTGYPGQTPHYHSERYWSRWGSGHAWVRLHRRGQCGPGPPTNPPPHRQGLPDQGPGQGGEPGGSRRWSTQPPSPTPAGSLGGGVLGTPDPTPHPLQRGCSSHHPPSSRGSRPWNPCGGDCGHSEERRREELSHTQGEGLTAKLKVNSQNPSNGRFENQNFYLELGALAFVQ